MTNPDQKSASPNHQKAERQGIKKINTFRFGFISGVILTLITTAEMGHLFLNVFKMGSISIGDKSFGRIASPDNSTDDFVARTGNNSKIEQNELSADDSKDANQAVNSKINQDKSNNDSYVESGDGLSNSSVSGETVSITVNYNSNEELPGFNSGEGYVDTPPDIGRFNDAILINNVGLGSRYAKFETREVFVNKKKYGSTFSLQPNKKLPTRVSFSLEVPGVQADAIFLQFGLADLDTDTTTLTYLVSIFGDGEIMWSNQVKYEESQIVSVVLDTKDIKDIFIEYQVVEAGGISDYRLGEHPLFFTEAKALAD